MKVRIDHDLCTGHGRCYTLADEVFSCDDSGFGEVIGDGVVPPDRVHKAELAAQNCPEGAIEVTD